MNRPFFLACLFATLVFAFWWHRLGAEIASRKSTDPTCETMPTLPGQNLAQPTRMLDAAAGLELIWHTMSKNLTEEIDGISRYPTTETMSALGTFTTPEIAMLLEASKLEPPHSERCLPLLSALFDQLATLEPDQALRMAPDLPPKAIHATLHALLTYWAQRDAATAQQWFDRCFPKPDHAFSSIPKIFARIVKEATQHPPVPASLVEALADSKVALKEPTEAREQAIVAWAKQNQGWAQALAATADEQNTHLCVLKQWLRHDFKESLQWMKDHPPEQVSEREEWSCEAMQALFAKPRVTMTRDDFEGLLDDTLGLVKEDLHIGRSPLLVLGSGIDSWLDLNPIAASQWVKSHLDQPWIDAVVATLVASVVKNDPESAFIWVAKIKDEQLRERTRQEAQNAWRRLDPVGAKQVLGSLQGTTTR